jgi:hypothetical protein
MVRFFESRPERLTGDKMAWLEDVVAQCQMRKSWMELREPRTGESHNDIWCQGTWRWMALRKGQTVRKMTVD